MTGVNLLLQERQKIPYPWTLTSCAKRTHTSSPFCSPFSVSLLYSFKRENIPSWELQKWVTNWDMSDDYTCTHCTHPSPFWHTYFLSSVIVQERKLYTPLFSLSGNSRNEWQIEIWVTNHFKILCHYYTWTLSWTTYYLTTQNNPVGETNSSTFSIAPDDPSSISIKLLCIFALTIIPTSFLTLLLYNARTDLSNMMMTREKRILIWLLINCLIKLTNYSCT